MRKTNKYDKVKDYCTECLDVHSQPLRGTGERQDPERTDTTHYPYHRLHKMPGEGVGVDDDLHLIIDQFLANRSLATI